MSALERAESAIRVEVERQVQANGSYSGPSNGSPDYVDTELDYGMLIRTVLMAVRDASDDTLDGQCFRDMLDDILEDTTND